MAPDSMQPTFRQRVHGLLEGQGSSRAGQVLQGALVALIVLNIAAVIVETVEPVAVAYGRWLALFETASLVVFSLEYVARVWSAPEDPRFAPPLLGRLRFIATPMALVDLVAILPAFLVATDLRMLRVLRLFRLVKLGRYSETMQVLNRVVVSRRRELGMSAIIVAAALTVCSSLVYYAEHDAQPEAFSSIPAAMWWGIVTLTTVGYGDIVPVTDLGKALAGLTVLAGLLVLALPVGIVASGFVEEMEGRRKADPCPHCGKLPHDEPSVVPVTPHQHL